MCSLANLWLFVFLSSVNSKRGFETMAAMLVKSPAVVSEVSVPIKSNSVVHTSRIQYGLMVIL